MEFGSLRARPPFHGPTRTAPCIRVNDSVAMATNQSWLKAATKKFSLKRNHLKEMFINVSAEEQTVATVNFRMEHEQSIDSGRDRAEPEHHCAAGMLDKDIRGQKP